MRLGMGNIRRFFILVIILTGIYLLVVFVRMRTDLIVDRSATLVEIEKAIKKQTSGKACKHPVLPVNSTEMNKFFWDVPPINCNAAYPDWVTVQGSFCIINEEAKKKYGEIYCQFTDVLRENDFTLTSGHTTQTNTQYQLTNSDVVKVQCKSISGAHWRSVLTGIRYDPLIKSKSSKKIPENVLPMDILIFGFDSLSHNTFIRKLPKTYKFLTEVLHAQVLNGYNIVGDGTPQALIPILTGQNELELPETRKRISGSNYVDIYPFVWKEFANLGYITAYLEDTPTTGIFTYRLRGFDKTPTDHYMRPYYLAAEECLSSSPKYCIGAQPRHKIMLNYIEEFFRTYKRQRKFLFGFHGELSHDSVNLIGAADNDVLEWLHRLYASGLLNNTVFMFISDHGHRFAKIRDTIQGKQEERLPFFSIILPKWFQKKYKVAYRNLRNNIDMLTTPYDIYPTIKHLLNWGEFGVGDLNQRSISLFNTIPEERSCADAYIEPHWCTCLDWEPLPTTSPLAHDLANALVTKINDLTAQVRHLCHLLQVHKIVWVTKLSPNDNMLKFQRSADYDGFKADLSGNVVIKYHLYQIKIIMTPSKGVYEASITHYRNGTFYVNERDISRTNKYGSQANCILEKFPDLRKYCFCVL